MGSVVKNLASGVGDMASGVAHGNVGQFMGGMYGAALSPITGSGQDIGKWTGIGQGGPDAPGTNQDLLNLQQQQIQNAQQFRQNLPGLENQMDTQNKVSAQGQLTAGASRLNSNNSSRGLGYGGINQGQQQALRAGVQQSVAKQASQVHQGLINESNQMDQEAISTGVGIQNQAQQQQNAIYANAMANMNAQNGIIGSAAGAGLLIALM